MILFFIMSLPSDKIVNIGFELEFNDAFITKITENCHLKIIYDSVDICSDYASSSDIGYLEVSNDVVAGYKQTYDSSAQLLNLIRNAKNAEVTFMINYCLMTYNFEFKDADADADENGMHMEFRKAYNSNNIIDSLEIFAQDIMALFDNECSADKNDARLYIDDVMINCVTYLIRGNYLVILPHLKNRFTLKFLPCKPQMTLGVELKDFSGIFKQLYSRNFIDMISSNLETFFPFPEESPFKQKKTGAGADTDTDPESLVIESLGYILALSLHDFNTNILLPCRIRHNLPDLPFEKYPIFQKVKWLISTIDEIAPPWWTCLPMDGNVIFFEDRKFSSRIKKITGHTRLNLKVLREVSDYFSAPPLKRRRNR